MNSGMAPENGDSFSLANNFNRARREESLKVIEKRCSAVLQDVPDTGIYPSHIAQAIGVSLTMDEYRGLKKIAD